MDFVNIRCPNIEVDTNSNQVLIEILITQFSKNSVKSTSTRRKSLWQTLQKWFHREILPCHFCGEVFPKSSSRKNYSSATFSRKSLLHQGVQLPRNTDLSKDKFDFVECTQMESYDFTLNLPCRKNLKFVHCACVKHKLLNEILFSIQRFHEKIVITKVAPLNSFLHFQELSFNQSWFHVKFQWQNIPDIFTLCGRHLTWNLSCRRTQTFTPCVNEMTKEWELWQEKT